MGDMGRLARMIWIAVSEAKDTYQREHLTLSADSRAKNMTEVYMEQS